MTITVFDRQTAITVQAEMLAALQDVAKKHGILILNGGGSINDTECTFKFKTMVTDRKAAVDSSKTEWEQYASIIGYKKEWFGKTFRHGNTFFTISGVAPTRRSNPIKAKNPRGKEYLFKLYDVAMQFGDTSVPAPIPSLAQEMAAEHRAMRRMARHER